MNTQLSQTATRIVQRLQQAGYQAFWVGGCVRDTLLGREPHDYDIVTNAIPDQIEACFPHTIPVGRQFGIVNVIEEGAQFQVATFRTDGQYEDGRRPETVTFATAEEDAQRRDFTVNGLFFDPITQTLHDWVDGRADINAGVIRAIGNPAQRFAEDHLRLLRAVRQAVQLNLSIHPATMAAIQTAAADIRKVSAERVRDELTKLFKPPFAGRGLALLRESGLLQHVLPEISAMIGCEQPKHAHPEGDVYTHTLLALTNLPKESHPLLPWAVLLHDVAKPLTQTRDESGIHFYRHEEKGAELAREILNRLRFPANAVHDICIAIENHMLFFGAKRFRRSTSRRILLRPTIDLELELHRLDCLASNGNLDSHTLLVREAEALRNAPKIREPLITGRHLLELGLKTGPVIGQLLAEVREMQLNDELQTAEEALAWVRQAAESNPMR